MFKDFSVYTYVNGAMPPDPAVAYVRYGADVSSGAVGAAWTRAHMTFVPDRDSTYLAVGARITSPQQVTPGSEHLQSQYLTKWQLERASNFQLTPQPYSPAREIQVVVKADRINLVRNPSFEASDNGWGVINGAHSRSTTVGGKFGSAAARVVTSADGETIFYSASTSSYRISTKPGMTYAAQAWSRAGATQGEVTMSLRWYDATSTLVSTSEGSVVDNTVGMWSQHTIVATAPSNSAYARMYFNLPDTLAGDVNYFDGMMVEQADEVRTYFDGSSGDDYVWETGPAPTGNAGDSRSYYYENRLDRNEALLRALRDVVPVGIGVGVPKFGYFTD